MTLASKAVISTEVIAARPHRRGQTARAIFALALAVLVSPAPAFPHGGGLNACGCHFNRKTGECHCHRNYGCGCECQPPSCEFAPEPRPTEPQMPIACGVLESLSRLPPRSGSFSSSSGRCQPTDTFACANRLRCASPGLFSLTACTDRSAWRPTASSCTQCLTLKRCRSPSEFTLSPPPEHLAVTGPPSGP